MKNNKSFFGLICAILLLLPGCMHVPTYRSESLNNVDNTFTHKYIEKNVTFQAKLVTTPEVHYLFGPQNKNLVKNTKIIYLSINNLSETDYILAPENISIASLTCKDVTKLIKTTNTGARFAGAAISGVVASPVPFNIWLHCIGPVVGLPSVVMLPFIIASAIAIPLGVVFLAKGIKSAVMNRRIKKDLKEKMIHKKITIKSGQHYEGLIFVKTANYKPDFTVTLRTKKNINNVEYNINLNQSLM